MKIKSIHIIVLLIGLSCSYLISSEYKSFNRGKTKSIARLSLDGSGDYNNKKVVSGISFSYDRILFKQDNIWSGLGFENLISRSLEDNSIKDIKFDSIYFFSRFLYEKKWASYLKIGYNILDKNLVQFNSSGLMWAFGVDYKLTHSWHIESGYHVFTTEDVDYSRIVLSLSIHFKMIND